MLFWHFAFWGKKLGDRWGQNGPCQVTCQLLNLYEKKKKKEKVIQRREVRILVGTVEAWYSMYQGRKRNRGTEDDKRETEQDGTADGDGM